MPFPDWLEQADRDAFLWVHRTLHGPDSFTLDAFFRWANELGNAWWALVLVGLWVALRPRVRDAVRAFVEAGLGTGLAAVASNALKRWVDRPRPMRVFHDEFATGSLHRALGEDLSQHSFPSGHTTTAFALATLVWAWSTALPAGRRRFVRSLAFLLALCAGTSRVYAGAHFPLDVAGGAVLGTVVTSVVLFLVAVVAGSRRPSAPSLPPPSL
jgi:undecaprenyl-diphosphatase